jgi:hypothetical protein
MNPANVVYNRAVTCLRYHLADSPVLIRSYPIRGKQINCMIWEAIRATTASALLFEGISIGPHYAPQIYVDAELVENNPIASVYREKEILETSTNQRPIDIACVVSLGCGNEHPTALKFEEHEEDIETTLWDYFRNIFKPNVKKEREQKLRSAMLKIAKDCERHHELTSALHAGDHNQTYFRLNVEVGMEDVAATDWMEEQQTLIIERART